MLAAYVPLAVDVAVPDAPIVSVPAAVTDGNRVVVALSYTEMTEFATGVVTLIVCRIPGNAASVAVADVESAYALNAGVP